MKRFLAQLLATVIIGGPLGALWGLSGSRIYEQASTWTRDEYLQNYESWREEGMRTVGPLGSAILLTVFLLIFVVLYERLKRWISRRLGIDDKEIAQPPK